MPKVPNHQVAGHRAVEGKLGPLIDESGHFCKPIQEDERGANEVAFYSKLSSQKLIPDRIRRFFPRFHGTRIMESSNGSGLRSHLILDDVVSNYKYPSIIDVKIGSRTWPPQESDRYIEKCMKKDRETSSLLLGFRLSGLQMYRTQDSGFWKPTMKSVQRLCPGDVKLVLRRFVSSSPFPESDLNPDCSFVSSIYGGSAGILSQLRELKAWFESQTTFHFYSCSILMMFDKQLALEGRDPRPEIKLIDFAHVLDAGGIIDHNFLGGLCSLIMFISEIVNSSNGFRAKDFANGSENGDHSENGHPHENSEVCIISENGHPPENSEVCIISDNANLCTTNGSKE